MPDTDAGQLTQVGARAFALTYEVDGKTYTTEGSNGLTVCATGPHCKLTKQVANGN